MKDFCKIFMVDNHQVLIRKSIDTDPTGNVRPTIKVSAFMPENGLIGLNPEMEWSNHYCCMDKAFDKFNQEFAEHIFDKMKNFINTPKKATFPTFMQN